MVSSGVCGRREQRVAGSNSGAEGESHTTRGYGQICSNFSHPAAISIPSGGGGQNIELTISSTCA